MKKKSILSLALAGVLTMGLMGCGSKDAADDKTIKIGVTPVPHREVVEHVIPTLEKKGYTVEIVEFSDYVQPNTSLEDGALDANYFQTLAYLEEFNENNGTNLVSAAEIHVEPMGAYSYKYKSIDDIAEGATVAIPNDPSNEARALNVLVSAGLIKVKEGDLITVADIIENPKNLQFTELEAAQLPRALDDIDIAVINGNYALDADLDVTKDAIFVEDENSQEMIARRNVLAVKEGNEKSEKIKDLIEVLTSDDVRTFIEEQYKGAVVPVF